MNALPLEVIKELQKSYIATFSEKEKIVDDAFSKHDWQALKQLLHKLAGSGATYSMPEITIICRHLETYLDQTVDPDHKIISESITVLKKIFKARKTGEPYVLKEDPVLKYFKNDSL
jgi:HPt (histidine-containing phosphotransfer) domain-containing protein